MVSLPVFPLPPGCQPLRRPLDFARGKLHAYVFTSDFTNFNRIVVKLNGEGRQAYSLAVGGSTGGGVSGHAELRMQESGGNTDLAVSTTDINDGTWHHVAGTFDGTNLRIYVDGILMIFT